MYFDLLKKCLTNTLFQQEPDVDAPQPRFIQGFRRHYIEGPAISMLPLSRFDHLQECVLRVLMENVPGDLIETGVWRGGATIFMAAMLDALEVRDRNVWVADSFEGLPEPDATRFPKEAKAHHGPVMSEAFSHLAASLEDVRANFVAFSVLSDRVKFLKGWFKDTLPVAPIKRLAVLRLDGDYYESTWDALSALYDKVSVGGFVIVDDYGEDAWTNCREAVDTFRATHGISEPMIKVDRPCWYWRRTV